MLACDPRENQLLSRNPHKSDDADAYNLCRLLRLGNLQEVYQAEDDHRGIFKAAAQRYLSLRKQQVALKQKIKATFRRWGVLSVEGQRIYSEEGRKDCLARLEQPEVTTQLQGLYRMLDVALETQAETKSQMKRLGRQYPEIEEFQEMPGVGPIGAHLFDAIVQTPHRFATKQKLWSYSGLGIRNQTSDGKPLGYEKLDSKGRTELKALSYRAWLAAIRHSPNEVETFFEQSIGRTGDRTHARLNTQRKILATLLSLWTDSGRVPTAVGKNDTTYRPKRFLGSE